ncbi:MAG: dicarboxylate/amino acid:cation symporter [Gemmatimonadaceae bacterium]
MSLTTKVLIALVAGMVAGIAIATTDIAWLRASVRWIEPLGTIFINAIRMTVIPLVVGSLISGVAAAPDLTSIGRIGRRAIAFYVVTLFIAAGFAALVGPLAFSTMTIDPAAVAALRASTAEAAARASETARTVPNFAQWLVDLVPPNPIKSAADGAMLPLIAFTLAFAIALTRVEGTRRDTVARFFHGVADTALVLVQWVLKFAPIGVFALALALAAKLGVSAAGAVAGYMIIVSLLVTIFVLLFMYPIALVLGKQSLREFARAVFPVQAVAFSSRSSLAALPAMMESARTQLKLSEPVVAFLIPLSASLYRIGAAIGMTIGVVFVAKLYGVDMTTARLATIVVTVVITTFSVPGIPAGSIISMVPVLLAADLPVEGIGILLGADTIPDMFRTTANASSDMVAAVAIGGKESEGTQPGLGSKV